jgi:deoxyribodipyrimidine photo-lyase
MNRGLFWFRRDLRINDNIGLSQCSKDCDEVLLCFIFDSYILEKLDDKSDQRLSFIYDSLKEMELELNKTGSSIIIGYGKPEVEIPKIIKEYKIKKLYKNKDYEPYAKQRDEKVNKNIKNLNVDDYSFKDLVCFEANEVLNGKGENYKVFTPYKNKWLSQIEDKRDQLRSTKVDSKKFVKIKNNFSCLKVNWLEKINFTYTPPTLKAGRKEAIRKLSKFKNKIFDYKKDRDYPSIDGTSLLSVYSRHGNISVRELINFSLEFSDDGSKTWLSEIIWREFYQCILDKYPYVTNSCYKTKYDQIKWPGSKENFKKWCVGNTGTPIIDASMRCLNKTGLMHNRLRMIVASYLCKTMLIDWKLGERYFAKKLLDYDLAANNGGWQWASSTGCDSVPYFRIFNPYRQSERFDPQGKFIIQWCPELKILPIKYLHRPELMKKKNISIENFNLEKDYFKETVNYESQREKCLDMYKNIK